MRLATRIAAVSMVLSVSIVIGCFGGQVDPVVVQKIQAQQTEIQAQLDRQQAMAQQQLAAAQASGDQTKIDTAQKNIALVAKAREYIQKGTTAVNLVLAPDGSIDFTTAGGMLSAIPGWGPLAGLAVTLGGAIYTTAKKNQQVKAAQAANDAASAALSDLWNNTPETAFPDSALKTTTLATIHANES